MNRHAEIVVLQEHLAACARLTERLRQVRAQVAHVMPMTAERVSALNADDHIAVLAFLKIFEQLEDALGRTLKTIAMLMQLGKSERLTPRDVIFRAVALGILNDGKAWADAVRTRNELAHEYPLQPDKQAEQVTKAWDQSETLFETERAIHAFVERERLLCGDL